MADPSGGHGRVQRRRRRRRRRRRSRSRGGGALTVQAVAHQRALPPASSRVRWRQQSSQGRPGASSFVSTTLHAAAAATTTAIAPSSVSTKTFLVAAATEEAFMEAVRDACSQHDPAGAPLDLATLHQSLLSAGAGGSAGRRFNGDYFSAQFLVATAGEFARSAGASAEEGSLVTRDGLYLPLGFCGAAGGGGCGLLRGWVHRPAPPRAKFDLAAPRSGKGDRSAAAAAAAVAKQGGASNGGSSGGGGGGGGQTRRGREGVRRRHP